MKTAEAMLYFLAISSYKFSQILYRSVELSSLSGAPIMHVWDKWVRGVTTMPTGHYLYKTNVDWNFLRTNFCEWSRSPNNPSLQHA